MSLSLNRRSTIKRDLLESEYDTYCHDVEERAYISRKISKIRWKPEGIDDYSSYFITGSYDNPERNNLDLWRYSPRQEPSTPTNGEFAPSLKSSLSLNGNVTGLDFLNKDFFAFTTGESVGLVKCMPNKTFVESPDTELQLIKTQTWDNREWSESQKITYTCLHSYDSQLIAAGSLEGNIFLMTPDSSKNVAALSFSTIPVHGLRFIGKDELISTCLLGTISLWDLRVHNLSPVNCVPLSRTERVGITAVTNFPTEKHMLVCGGQNGTVSVFDLRNLPIPVKVFKTSTSPVAELRFHPTRYSILFSCTTDGQIWQWSNFFQLFDPIRNSDLETFNQRIGQETNINKSVLLDFKNVTPEVKSLLKNNKFYINSMDLNKDRLISGTDNECVIAIQSLQLN